MWSKCSYSYSYSCTKCEGKHKMGEDFGSAALVCSTSWYQKLLVFPIVFVAVTSRRSLSLYTYSYQQTTHCCHFQITTAPTMTGMARTIWGQKLWRRSSTRASRGRSRRRMTTTAWPTAAERWPEVTVAIPTRMTTARGATTTTALTRTSDATATVA